MAVLSGRSTGHVVGVEFLIDLVHHPVADDLGNIALAEAAMHLGIRSEGGEMGEVVARKLDLRVCGIMRVVLSSGKNIPSGYSGSIPARVGDSLIGCDVRRGVD
jgi:hypothetical protein